MMEKERVVGVDLLRIIAMFMVVVLHMQGFADMENVLKGSVNYHGYRVLDQLCMCAVDCFAVISGYVMYRNQDGIKSKKLLSLWLQVLFFSMVNTIWSYSVLKQSIEVEDILPVLSNKYWYVTAYIGLYVFSPLLNKAIEAFNKNEAKKILFSFLVFFSVLPTLRHADPFSESAGYSVFWLIILYCVGAFIHKYEISQKKSWAILVLIINNLVLFLGIVVLDYLTLRIMGAKHGFGYLISYISPFIIVNAVFLLLLLKDIRYGKAVKKIVTMVAPFTLGVYLAHIQSPIFDLYLNKIMDSVAQWNVFLYVVGVLGLSLAVFIVGILVEKIRSGLFDILRINWLINYIGDKLDIGISKILKN